MKKIIFIVASALLSVNNTAIAQAYKCPEKDGSIAIRSVPCMDYDEFKRTGIMPRHDLQNKAENQQSNWSGNGKTILNHDAVFCTNKKLLDRLAGLVNDPEAFKRLYTAAVANYQCRMAYKGQKLYLEDTHIFSGSAEVRYPGSPQIWWTNIEYVMKE